MFASAKLHLEHVIYRQDFTRARKIGTKPYASSHKPTCSSVP